RQRVKDHRPSASHAGVRHETSCWWMGKGMSWHGTTLRERAWLASARKGRPEPAVRWGGRPSAGLQDPRPPRVRADPNAGRAAALGGRVRLAKRSRFLKGETAIWWPILDVCPREAIPVA